MVGRSKSETKKLQIARKQHDDLMARAVEAYRIELQKDYTQRPRGARTICHDFENLCQQEGKTVRLSHTTLIRLARGGQTRGESNSEKSWLTNEETCVVINYIIEIGSRGFPLSHRRLKEHADEICRARLGDSFPEKGMGKNWTTRFVEKHSDKIKMSWSRPLESKRARAVNPITNKAWFDLLGDTMRKYNVMEENTYAVDEMGCQPSDGEEERVIGGQKHGPQYQQRDGNRENITVLVNICADGTATPPAIIYKGSAYQVKWKQDNPANASLGYSKKGWTDGEIGIEWMKEFDKQTAAKANGKYRLLLVDGHNSHYTRGFLAHARTHQILILCYPSHATHVYQGLDVVVFSVVKRYLSEERDRWERETGEMISKQNFITVYGRAHLRALTPQTIKAAFRKTGVWPFDPRVVTEDMIAPSRETSCEGHLPVVPATPVRVVAKLLRDLSIKETNPNKDKGGLTDSEGPSELPLRTNTLSTIPENQSAISKALQQLSQTSFAYLVSSEQRPTIPTVARMQHNTQDLISPAKSRQVHALSITPKTRNEIALLASLRESEARAEMFKRRILELQASNVLNEMYCNMLRQQLSHQEKKKNAQKGKGKLVGDGLPRLLSGDEFYEKVVEWTQWQEREEREKGARKKAREERGEALVAWRTQEEARKRDNNAKRQRYRVAVQTWEAAKTKAKEKKQKFGQMKPKMEKLASPIPKPPVFAHEQESSGDENSENDDENDGSDEN